MNLRRLRDYTLVSGFCFLLNNLILIGMDRAAAPLPLAIAASFLVCVIVGFVLHGRFSFHQPLESAAFARYVGAMSLNVPLAFASLWLCRHLLRMEFAAPLATTATTLVNFTLCRFAFFGRREALQS